MIDNKNRSSSEILLKCFSLLLSLLCFALICDGDRVIAGPVSGSYAVSIGESTRLLEAELKYERGEIDALQLQAIEHEESCKNPSARLHDRNRVALMLQNTSEAVNTLSSFDIDLKQFGYEFGGGDLPSDGFNGSLVLQSNRTDPGVSVFASYGTTDNTVDQTKLQVEFSGLLPGTAAIFRIDLDPVPFEGIMYPDYRGILLGGDMGLGPTEPAMISATFSNDGMQASTPSMPFAPDVPGVITTSGILESYHAQASSQMYGQTGTTEVIPEPSTAILMLAASAGLLSMRMRRQALR